VTIVKSKTVMVALLLLLPLISCKGIEPVPAGFTTYTDPSGYFSISHPASWTTFPPLFTIRADKDFFLEPVFPHNDQASVFVAIIGEPHIYVDIQVQSVTDFAPSTSLTQIMSAWRKLQTGAARPAPTATRIGGRAAYIWEWKEYPGAFYEHPAIGIFLITDGLLWSLYCRSSNPLKSEDRDNVLTAMKSLRIGKLPAAVSAHWPPTTQPEPTIVLEGVVPTLLRKHDLASAAP
jgi:hypothetical protein